MDNAPAILASCMVALSGVAQGATATASLPGYHARVVNPKLVDGIFEPVSRAFFICGTDGTILRSNDGRAWTYADVPTAADLARIESDTAGRVLIAVGAKGTILRSQDAGKSWRLANTSVPNSDLRALVHHGPGNAWIAAGAAGTLLRSLDDGMTWQQVNTGERTQTFETLFVEPRRHTLLVGGTDGVLGNSTDAGTSWNFASIVMEEPRTPITRFRILGDRLVAASALGRLLISEDGGFHWSLRSTGANVFFTDGAFDPGHGSFVLTGHTGDLYRSQDDGDSWQRIEIDFDGKKHFLSAVRFDERTGSLLAVGHHGAMARSTDGGKSWRVVASASNASSESVVHDARRGRFVAFGDGGFIQDSRDSGASWRQVSPDLSLYLREVMVLGGGEIIATGELGGILRSTDDGASWQTVEVAYPDANTPPNLRSLVAAPRGDALITAGAPGTILRSQDRGRSWRVTHWTPLEAEEAFPWILVDRSSNSAVVIEARGSMYVSRTGGRDWQRSRVATDRELWHGAALARRVMLAAGQKGVVARSEDAGANWALVDAHTESDLFGSFVDERTGTFFLMGSRGTLLRSSDLGKAWRHVASGTTHALRRMLADLQTPALVSFGEQGAIVRSEDGGMNWQPVASGTVGELRTGLHEPGSGALIVVGQQGAILRSADAGKTWQVLQSHTQRHFRSAAFDARSGNLIAVGERIVKLTREPAARFTSR